MSKELKDYLHLYCNPFSKIKVLIDGKEVKYLWDIDVADGGYVNITAADKEFRSIEIAEDDDGWNVYNDDESLSRIKPFLRPVSNMTQEESHRWNNGANSYQSYAARVKYLLDRHIDLFGLIEAGLAIDKTKHP